MLTHDVKMEKLKW